LQFLFQPTSSQLVSFFDTAYLEKKYYLEEYYSDMRTKENLITTWAAVASIISVWVILIVVVVMKNG